MLRSGIICFLALQTICTNWVQRHAAGGSPCGRTRFFPTIKQLISYKQQRSGNNVLHFANCLPDLNFPFSIFNFQFKNNARVIMFELLQTVFTNGVQRHAAGGSPLSGGKNYSNVTLGKYNCLYIKLSARIGNGGLPCGRIISAPTKLRKQLKCYARA